MTKQDLIELGFNPKVTGFHYLYEAVKMVIENPTTSIGLIYRKLAQKNNINWTAVERAIRYCIENSKSEYKENENSLAIATLAIRFQD